MRHTPARALRLIGEPAAGPAGLRLRVAIATRDTRNINEPLGRAAFFCIYEVAPQASELVGVVEFAATPRKCAAANDNPDDCQRRIEARLEALAGCHVIFAQQIGDVAAAAAMKRRIHPIEMARDEPIAALLARCQAMLSANPPPWLRRITAGTIGGTPEQDDAVAVGPACECSSSSTSVPVAAAL